MRLRHVWSQYAILLCLCLFCSVLSAHSPTNHLQRALELVNSGDLAGAEHEARLAIGQPQTQAVAWAMLGTIRLQQKKYQEGAEFLRHALKLDPHLVGARVSLGGVY